MKRFFGLLLLICLNTNGGSVFGQKVFKPIKASLKAKNGTEALKLVSKLEGDTTVNALPQLYDMGKEAQIVLNDVENEKLYLKQPYDTAKFFNTTWGIYDYVLKCDYKEQVQLAQSGSKMKFHKKNRQVVHQYYNNLNAGARYFYSKKNYGQAAKFLETYLDMPYQPIWGNDKSVCTSQLYISNAHLYEKCAYLSKAYQKVGRYKEVTLADTSSLRRSTLETMSLAAKALNDTVRYANLLKLGIDDYPDNDFFFSHLADFYAGRADYKAILNLADNRLRLDSVSTIALEARSLALMNMYCYKQALSTALYALEKDSTLRDAYFYIGAIYCNMALMLEKSENVQDKAYKTNAAKKKNLYKAARPYLEKYRAIAPNEERKWAPLLYRVYFTLNDGPKFEEIERVLSNFK